MIKINLIGEPTAAATTKRKRPEISLGARPADVILLAAIVLSAIVVGLVWWRLSSRLDDLKARESALTRERDQLQAYIDKVDELESKRAKLKEQIDIINELKAKQHGPVRVMDEISKALPDLVWLTQLSLNGSTVELHGMAMDENAVANYITNLDQSPFFSEPVLRDMSRKGSLYSFQLTCVFHFIPETEGNDSSGGGAGGRS